MSKFCPEGFQATLSSVVINASKSFHANRGQAPRTPYNEVDFVFLKEGVEVISFGGSVQKRVLTGFGVEKAAHGIELTEVKSENFHSTSLHGFGVGIL